MVACIVKIGNFNICDCLIESNTAEFLWFFSGDVDGADKSQRDLATGYPSQCAGWIVVLKRLINESRAALPSTDDGTAVPNAEPTGFMVPLPKE